MSISNEKDLVERAKSGDLEAFEQLIIGCQKKVFNIAFRMVGNYDDANELAQEVFIKAFRSIKNFKGDSSFSTWIYRITANVCLDELRKRKNRTIVSLDQDIELNDGDVKRQMPDNAPTPDMEAESNEVKSIVNESIQQLPDDYKSMIILRDIQGFSYDEISKIVNCPEGTVKSRINRARQALKKILQAKKELFDDEFVK
ncbi:sigma-70 family RNA polymerase sigma factor [Acetivibrio clariflavus]|uniref:RNA polymerase, sigma-24 subunit, RpoE n=1 Tax=Acetivibrio clariflavus (strain DSM 19732 / NBRC 101661 / EBR45) TaxID=720554 RepID=G8M1K0_ACECE|nr:sigma-70 family RNA polymerase sigma factor [Acetivibrio clariflavus]AEV69215.1 RNA polymerase, sigma-24 subunit, RpoE [Acetivibrio clariflavus DSM 19732]HPU41408.1 sigma-70 family RNA polymerase sigma factor [Acetivibrio clariflavus]